MGHFELWIKDPMSNQGSENSFILSLGTPPYEELAFFRALLQKLTFRPKHKMTMANYIKKCGLNSPWLSSRPAVTRKNNLASLQREAQFSFDWLGYFPVRDSGIESVFSWLYSPVLFFYSTTLWLYYYFIILLLCDVVRMSERSQVNFLWHSSFFTTWDSIQLCSIRLLSHYVLWFAKVLHKRYIILQISIILQSQLPFGSKHGVQTLTKRI